MRQIKDMCADLIANQMAYLMTYIVRGESSDRDSELQQPVSIGASRCDSTTRSYGDSLRWLAISRVFARLEGCRFVIFTAIEVVRGG